MMNLQTRLISQMRKKMNKFDKIFEETMTEMNYAQVSDEDYQKIADESKLDDKETTLFIELMKTRFKGSYYAASYAKEWADRIKGKRAWIYGDGPTRISLEKLGYKLGKEEEVLKKEQNN